MKQDDEQSDFSFDDTQQVSVGKKLKIKLNTGQTSFGQKEKHTIQHKRKTSQPTHSSSVSSVKSNGFKKVHCESVQIPMADHSIIDKLLSWRLTDENDDMTMELLVKYKVLIFVKLTISINISIEFILLSR